MNWLYYAYSQNIWKICFSSFCSRSLSLSQLGLLIMAIETQLADTYGYLNKVYIYYLYLFAVCMCFSSSFKHTYFFFLCILIIVFVWKKNHLIILRYMLYFFLLCPAKQQNKERRSLNRDFRKFISLYHYYFFLFFVT